LCHERLPRLLERCSSFFGHRSEDLLGVTQVPQGIVRF
jgi:hypothetical protein